MSHADAFLHAICAHPADDAPRLIYADWLDDHGDPARAEFIRVQCELARLPADSTRRWRLEDRERRLLAGREAAWAGPAAGLVESCEFHRGFVERVDLAAAVFLLRGEELFRLAPVRHARLRRLRELTPLLEEQTREDAFAGLLSRLTSLDVSGEPLTSLPGVGVALLTLPVLPRLTALNLDNTALGVGGVRALAASPALKSVTHLDLSRNIVSAEGVEALAESPHLKRLTALRLSLAGRLNEGALALLLGGPLLARLTALHLHHSGLGEPEVRRLAAAPAIEGLTTLDLSFNPLGAAGVWSLAASSHLPRLTTLNLSHTDLGDPGAGALAESSLPNRLIALDLSLNRIGDPGARALAETMRPSRLTRLDLVYNGRLTADGRKVLSDRFGERVCLFHR